MTNWKALSYNSLMLKKIQTLDTNSSVKTWSRSTTITDEFFRNASKGTQWEGFYSFNCNT